MELIALQSKICLQFVETSVADVDSVVEQLDLGHLQGPETDARFTVDMDTQNVRISRVCRHHVCRIAYLKNDAGFKAGLDTWIEELRANLPVQETQQVQQHDNWDDV